MNMPITASKPESNYKLAPAGTHIARIFKIIHFGTLPYEYQGEQKTAKFIRLYWELPTEIDKFTYKKEDGTEEEVEKPFAVSREFTLSMGSKSNLRPIVEGVIGTALSDDEAYAFDFENLLGKDSLITITHKKSADGSRTYANVTGTMPLMKGQIAPAAVNQAKIYDVNTISEEEVGEVPEWIREKMTESVEYKARFLKKAGNTDVPYPDGPVDDFTKEELDKSDIPFN